MAEGSGHPPSEKSSGEISLRRVAEFFQNVLNIERSVRNLRKENEELRQHVGVLQRQVDEHNGQLKVILTTLNATMSDRIEASAEKAALTAVIRFLETLELNKFPPKGE